MKKHTSSCAIAIFPASPNRGRRRERQTPAGRLCEYYRRVPADPYWLVRAELGKQFPGTGRMKRAHWQIRFSQTVLTLLEISVGHDCINNCNETPCDL